MTARIGIARLVSAGALALAAVALLALAVASQARADAAYDKVASAYAQSGGQLDHCAFTRSELEAALRGIPPEIRDVVPDIRRAIADGIAAHQRGDCRGARAGGATPGSAGGTTTPGTSTTPGTPTTPGATAPDPTSPDAPTSSTPTDTTTAPAAPPTGTTTPPGSEPGPGTHAPTTEVDASGGGRDLTPLWIALIVAGALLLAALFVWGWGWMRGWDPAWVARARHAWGEAGFRTTSTWSEFTDWLRLGR